MQQGESAQVFTLVTAPSGTTTGKVHYIAGQWGNAQVPSRVLKSYHLVHNILQVTSNITNIIRLQNL